MTAGFLNNIERKNTIPCPATHQALHFIQTSQLSCPLNCNPPAPPRQHSTINTRRTLHYLLWPYLTIPQRRLRCDTGRLNTNWHLIIGAKHSRLLNPDVLVGVLAPLYEPHSCLILNCSVDVEAVHTHTTQSNVLHPERTPPLTSEDIYKWCFTPVIPHL